MRRFSLFLSVLMVLVLACAACSGRPGRDNRKSLALIPFTELPESYGELVSVTFAPQQNDEFGWREMWFQNEETGTLTYVPVILPEWKYDPKLVKVITRP